MNRQQVRLAVLIGLLVVAVICGGAWSRKAHVSPHDVAVGVGPKTDRQVAGTILGRGQTTAFSLAQEAQQMRYVNGPYAIAPKYTVEKTVISYRSYEVNGTPIEVYARIYQPVGVTGAPILGFAPGTTGIGDACAASLEQPLKTSWADYEAHMLTYASQGYAVVITDYEGMRDPARIHHYMVGQVEGRSVLDSVRALIRFDRNTNRLSSQSIFLAGYSQGGHSALWADQIAATYAPELHLSGVVGFGAVTDVAQTLADVTRGADLDWFGPYVLTSYADYYHETYPVDQILLPQWVASLSRDATSHCIDSDLAFWGTDAAKVYTPAFITAMQSNTIESVAPQLAARMQENNVGPLKSSVPVLLNGGVKDNVVLPSQQAHAQATFCSAQTAPVHLKEYPGIDHYSTMAASLSDTLAWMGAVRQSHSIPNDCSAA